MTPAEAVEPEPSKAQAGGGNAKEKAEVERIPKSRRDCVVVWVYPMTIVGNNLLCTSVQSTCLLFRFGARPPCATRATRCIFLLLSGSFLLP